MMLLTSSAWRAALRPLLDPYRRYRHAKLIHAARVALSVLVSIALTSGLRMPHGEWASITVLIVIGGLQHHGNIRKKAAERALGTVIGAAAGLSLIVLQSASGWPLLTSVLMAVACGVCAYHAIGKAGYIALLSAITMVIVAGHGDNEIADGLWRAVNVLVGIALALAFSFALPLYATYSWRYTLADALRGCAAVHARIGAARAVDDTAHLREMARLGTLLVQLRSLMPSVAKETGLPLTQIEAIQRGLRRCISTLEMLSGAQPAPDDADGRAYVVRTFAHDNRRLRAMLFGAGRALKFGALARLQPGAVPPAGAPPTDAPARLSEFVSLSVTLDREIESLRARLLDTARLWNL
jgi:uncharacterized membrane protein YccC